ncbi:MAG: YggS family pyridoxal phosphate-dependent enzyme [Gammaproteobacteria bacterium]
MSSSHTDISANLGIIRRRIHQAAAASGRDPDNIRLIAVSKYMPEDYVRQAMLAGQYRFGENTIQDALSKQTLIDDPTTEWHFIGHLQSNKAKHIPGNFAWLHTLDSIKLARKLAHAAAVSATALRVLLQVNIAGDPGKSGLPATALFRFIDELLRAELDPLKIRGLMTIGQRDATTTQRRSDFAALYELGQQCARRYGSGLFREYSMGMSGDFEDAIAEGATMIRIGSAIFGPRPSAGA